MFEDKATGSWWRQATGEAIAGPRKGAMLAELPSQQVTLTRWLALHPTSLVMQPDSALRDEYTKDFGYETGASRKRLTGTDTISWHEKAWVVGFTVNHESKAYDWNRLRRKHVVNDELGGTPIVLILAADSVSFFEAAMRFAVREDSLVTSDRTYSLDGRGVSGELKPVFASQEFWHSWRTFHPGTAMY